MLIRQRFPMSVNAARALLHFLDTKNVIYKAAHEHNLSCDIDAVMQLDNFIVDRSDNSEVMVSPKLVRMIQFNTTSYSNLGTEEEVPPARVANGSRISLSVDGSISSRIICCRWHRIVI